MKTETSRPRIPKPLPRPKMNPEDIRKWISAHDALDGKYLVIGVHDESTVTDALMNPESKAWSAARRTADEVMLGAKYLNKTPNVVMPGPSRPYFMLGGLDGLNPFQAPAHDLRELYRIVRAFDLACISA